LSNEQNSTYVFCQFADDFTSPANLNQVQTLLEKYKSCLATRKLDEAKKTSEGINSVITNGMNTTGMELLSFAQDQLKNGRCEESIPVFFAAASMFHKEGDLMRMSCCLGAKGIQGANTKIIKCDATMKDVVKRHVIPLMHDVRNLMLQVTTASEKDKSWWMGQVLEYIAYSAQLVDDHEAAKRAREEFKASCWGTKKRNTGLFGM